MSDGKPARSPCQALYIHIPFCARKCPYCSFFSVAGRQRQYQEYVNAVRQQINRHAQLRVAETIDLRTIFMGGGTPTTLAPDLLAALLTACLQALPHTLSAGDMEISIEANPATVNSDGLRALRRAGFNRISIGIQSLNDTELVRLGRLHTAAEAAQAVRSARQAGFANINLDLIYGLPGQTAANWRTTLHQALELEPDHLALYELTLEEDTPFARDFEAGKLALPAEEEVLAMLEITGNLTARAGFQRYEISNYARPGFQCRHNLTYWHNLDYLGLGAGAVSCLAGRRRQAIRNIPEYIRRMKEKQDVFVDAEQLDRETRFRETMIMGLRMTKGINIEQIRQRFGLDPKTYYGETLARLIKTGLIRTTATHIRLSEKGLLLANQVMRELV